jgi:hypothetical protein
LMQNAKRTSEKIHNGAELCYIDDIPASWKAFADTRRRSPAPARLL